MAMCIEHQNNTYYSREQSEKPFSKEDEEALTEEESEEDSEDRQQILCRQCYAVITCPKERMSVQGSHEHTFANPGGIIYQIGCFRSAVGCSQIGPPAEDFSWFKGFSWRVDLCRTCMTHVGWLFVAQNSDSFYGLIFNRLVEEM